MGHCCYDCPVAVCTVRELLQYVSSNSNYYRSCDNGSSAVAVVPAFIVMLFDLVIGAIIFIVMSRLFYHNVYKKILMKCRHQKDQSDGRSDQENIGRGSAEGVTYDVVNNEAQVTAAPEMKQNEAYAGGKTGLKN